MAENRIDVALVKLVAVLIVVMSLRSFTDYMFWFAETAPIPLLVGGLILHLLVPLAIAWTLWRFPNLIVSSLAPGQADTDGPINPPQDYLLIGVALIGLYALVFGVIDLAYFEGYRFAERELAELTDFPDRPVSPQVVAGRVANVVQIVFGAVLIAGRHVIARLIRGLRGAGLRPS